MFQHRIIAISCMACLAFLIGASTGGEPKKGGEKPDAKAEARDEAFNQVSAAYELIDFARRQKSPLALVAAVQMLHQTAETEADVKIEEGELDKLEPKTERLAKLLDEAGKMNKNKDKNIAAVIEQMRETIKEQSRPIVPYQSGLFAMKVSAQTSFTREFTSGSSSIRITQTPGAGFVGQNRLRVQVTNLNNNQMVRNVLFIYANNNFSRSTSWFAPPGVTTYRIRIINENPGNSPSQAFMVYLK
jgi:hypothetical protein